MPADRHQEIATKCLNNVGKTFIENYSAADVPQLMAQNTPHGPGFTALRNAAKKGQPVILVTGHFGNHEAPALH